MSSPNVNYLQATNFRISIKRLPHSTFHAQRANVPSLQGNEIIRPTHLNPLKETYDKITYGDFTFTFIVDENMDNYTEIFKWMHGVGFPQDFDQFKELKNKPLNENVKSDLSLIVLNNNKKPIKEFLFRGAFPIMLSDLLFDTSVGYTQYVDATTTFTYDNFEILDIR